MPIYISQSALNDFISCNRKPYYRIFKPVEPIKSIDAIKGTIVHKALEHYWNDFDKAVEFIMNECLVFNLEHHVESELVYLVRNFFENFSGYVQDGDLIEHNFRIKIDDNAYLVGVLDRVSRGMVFDWKTGKRTPSQLENNVQFILYSYAYKKLFNSSPVGLYYASLRENKLVRYTSNEFNERVVFEELIPKYIDAVVNKQFVRTGVFNGNCFKCDWKEHCLEKTE